jgi:hypothetical protein
LCGLIELNARKSPKITDKEMGKLYITAEKALRRYNITADELEELVEAGELLAAVLELEDGEKTIYYDDDLAAYAAERDIKPNNFEHLKGNLLGYTEAALKYKLNPSNVSRWVHLGFLEMKGTRGRKKLVDEADVAYLAAKGKAMKMRSGKKVFSS